MGRRRAEREREDARLIGFVARENAGDCAGVHHGDAVAHAEDFGHLGRDHDNRHAALGQIDHEAVDLGFGADIDALSGLVEDENGGRDVEPAGERDLLLIAAGERAGLGVDRRGFDLEAIDVDGGDVIFGSGVDEAAGADRRERGHGDVGADGHLEDDAVLAAILGDVADSEADGVSGSRDADRRAVEEDFAAIGGSDAEEGLCEFGASGADEAGDAEDFAAADGEGNIVEAGGGAGEIARFEDRLPDGDRALGEDSGNFAADHELDEFGAIDLSHGAGGDVAAVAKDGDAVADFEDFIEAVGDVDDAGAGGAQVGNDAEETLGFALGEGGGGFVEDEDFGVRTDGLGDLDDLLFRHAEGGDEAGGVDVGAGAFEQIAGLARALFPIDAAEEAGRLEREGDVFGDGEVREERGLLIDGGDAESARDGRGVVRDGLAEDGERAGIGGDGAGHDLDEGGFAGPVFADERVDFARAEFEGDVF